MSAGVPTAAVRRRHAWCVWAVIALAAVASRAEALGLGEARVISGLNAPLVAEIAVVDATPAELEALRAEVPGRDVFARYGLERPELLASASVTLRTFGAGAPVLVLRTTQPVSEPFLTVLVAANWGRGRVLREFNLIVDRPSETAEPLMPMEVQAPAVAPGRSGDVERAPEEVPAPVSIRPEASESARPAPATVTVRSGDTLGRLAAAVARRTGVTRAQAMVGIYQANREAFGASMNDLRAGAVLRIPDAADLAMLPPSMVSAEVNRAVSQWRSRSGAPTQVADPTGRLRLVAPSEVSVGTGGEARADGAAPAARPAGADTRGDGDTAPSAEPVEQRLARIEQQLLEKQRLLEVTSAQLADLQAKAATAPQTGQTGLIATVQAMFGKVWWLWGVLLLAVLALVGLLLATRRRATAAEAELQAWAQAPRAESTAPPAPSTPAMSPASVESVPAPTATVPDAPEDMEGDPPTLEEAGSKIDLARAFIEMGDVAAARAELDAVLRIGDEAQREEAQRLLDSIA